jgi:ubiquinone/menaquinone biosynthesis C-methylase UbiE
MEKSEIKELLMCIVKEITDLRNKVDQIEKGISKYVTKDLKNQSHPIEPSLNDLMPPLSKIFDGSTSLEDFKETAETFLKYFIYLANLKPHERVLDVGCGTGRMAIPLTQYLNQEGHYEGFDIVADGIIWCQENVTPKFPNFHFQLADVFNKVYKPNGTYLPSNYRFPYENDFFDFVFLTSVFTHMLYQDVENYLREIHRVLKKNGRCLITFFLLNDESRNFIQKGKSILDFKYTLKDKKEYLTINRDAPEAAVCFEEKLVRDLYHRMKLEIKEPIFYGSWCGREHFLTCQDIVIACKDRSKVVLADYAGHLDLVEPSNPTMDAKLHMNGWAADLQKMLPAKAVTIVSDGKPLSVSPRMGTNREDVAQAYNNPRLVRSGWEVTFKASILGKGKHRLEFYGQLDEDQLKPLFYKDKKYFYIEIAD